MDTEEVRLPIELWRDIHKMATAIPNEFSITSPTFQYNEIYNADQYTRDWRAAAHTRRTIVLVSRTWYEIASEFLYSSLLFSNGTSPRSFTSIILRLRENRLGCWVKRVTITRFPSSDGGWNMIQHAISLLDDLRVYVICRGNLLPCLRSNPPAARITTLVLDTLPIDDVYQVLSNLFELKVLLVGGIRRSSPTRADTSVNLPNLHTFGITYADQSVFHWHEVIVAPSLQILHAPYHTPFATLRPYLSTIHTLGISNLDRYHEANVQDLLISPRVTTLILWMCSIPVDWVEQLAFLDLSQITSLEIRLDSVVQFTELSTDWEPFSFGFGLKSLLQLLADSTLTPALRRVELDISVNTFCTLMESTREGFCGWVATVEERGTVEVFVYKRASVNEHATWIRFTEMVASQPVFDFWEHRSGNDRNRWDTFARSTGRSNMTRRVRNGGMSCLWGG
jgi:hypothetical protein